MELFEGLLNHHDIELKLRKRKSFFQTEIRNRDTIIDMLFHLVFIPLNIFFKSMGLQIHNIELRKYTVGEQAISPNKFKKVLTIRESFDAIAIPDYVCQEAKDSANMSERKYTKFRKIINLLGGRMNSLYGNNKLRRQMEKFYTILPNSLGFYVKPREKVNYVLNKIYEKLNRNVVNDTFDLLISGDGLQLTRTHTNTVSFTFKVLNERDSAALYTLGNFYLLYFFCMN